MVTRIGGIRRKTRYKLRKGIRQRGKISLAKYFQNFDIGEKVYLSAEPAIQKGMYHPRFFGKIGIIKGKRGRCFEVSIIDVSKEKTLVAHPVHLKRGEVQK